MHVECYGSGSRVYFGLHGWSGDHATFAPLAAYLPAGAALYSADLPGYGRSPAPRSWELAAITDEIASAIAGVDSPATVIGNGSGAAAPSHRADDPDRSVRLCALVLQNLSQQAHRTLRLLFDLRQPGGAVVDQPVAQQASRGGHEPDRVFCLGQS